MNKTKIKIVNNIAKIRKERGLTQIELAKQVGVNRQTISSLETYKYYPTLVLACKIAKYFNLYVRDVFELSF